MAVKVNHPDDCETIDITIRKSRYPILFKNKVQELVEDCGMSQEEAETEVEGMTITLELMYEQSSGLFGIESDAVESCASNLFSPYSGENLIDWDEEN